MTQNIFSKIGDTKKVDGGYRVLVDIGVFVSGFHSELSSDPKFRFSKNLDEMRRLAQTFGPYANRFDVLVKSLEFVDEYALKYEVEKVQEPASSSEYLHFYVTLNDEKTVEYRLKFGYIFD